MMLSLCAVLVVGASVAGDTPRGTDVVARVEIGKLAAELRSSWDELEPLFVSWPSLGSIAATTRESWAEVATLVEKASGADLDHRTAVATVVADLDATGGLVWALVVRGAGAKEPADSGFLIDGHPAHRIAGHEVAWSIVGGALILGNERGLQRQVRHQLKSKHTDEDAIVLRARRLRAKAPLLIAVELPAPLRKGLSGSLPNVGPLVGAVHGGIVIAQPGRLRLQLSAGNADGEKAIEHGMRAFVALVRASTALLQGGAEAIVALDLLGERPDALPTALDAAALETLADDWLDGFRVDDEIRTRPGNVVEAELKLSSYRGLSAALAVMAIMIVPETSGPRAEAEVLLELLRRAQQAHHARTGKYISCGPIPAQVPKAPMAWPAGSCFDALGFAPPAEVRFQLVAGVEEGVLVLMASGDTDGDGRAEIWVLRGDEPAIRPLLSPP